jgi:hypothetical protein
VTVLAEKSGRACAALGSQPGLETIALTSPKSRLNEMDAAIFEC